MWEWYRIANNKQIEVDFFDDCNISLLLLSLESKNIAHYIAQLLHYIAFLSDIYQILKEAHLWYFLAVENILLNL